MYISEIRLKNFKKFEDSRFLFDHGINIIKGENENGKSTLLHAIIAALYADPSSQKYRNLYKSWNKEAYPVIEIDFFIEETLYALLKDFNTKEMKLRDVISSTEEKSAAVIVSQIKEFTGIDNENLLNSTVCIKHDEVSQLDAGKKSLQQALQDASLNNEGGVNIINLLRELKAKIDEMQVGLSHPAKHNGVVKRLQDEIALVQEELTKLEAKEQGAVNSSDKLDSLQKELEGVINQIEKYTKVVEDYEKMDIVQKDLDTVNEKIKMISGDIEKIQDFKDRTKTAVDKMTALGGMDVFEKMEAHHVKILELNKKMQEKQQALNLLVMAPRQEVQNTSPKRKGGWGLGIAGALLSIICIVLGAMQYIPLIFIGLLIGAVDAAYLYYKARHEEMQEEIPENTQQSNIEDLNRELGEIKNEQMKLIELCGASSVEDFFTKRTQLIALEADLTQMQTTIRTVLRGKEIPVLEEELRTAIASKKELESEMPAEVTVTKDQYMRDKRELELLKLDQKDIEAEIVEEKTKIKVVDADPAHLAQMKQKLDDLKTEQQEETEHLAVLKLIFDALSATKEEISMDISANIQEFVQQSLPAITDGRYNALKVDNDFHVEVFSTEKNEWIDPDANLSKGTVDQIYLSARLALADILTKSKEVPYFFDDVFLTFDEKRRLSLMEVLKYISRKHQIFIFTCHDFFDQYGKVIYVSESDS